MDATLGAVSSAKSPFDASHAEQVSRAQFGLEARAFPLPGYGDRNFRLDDAMGPVGTLKLALEAPSRHLLETQDAALDHLAMRGLPVPRARPGLNGHTLQDVRLPDGGAVMARLITWIPGSPLGAQQHVSHDLEREVGVVLARVAVGLADFDAPPVARAWAWDLAKSHLARAALPAVEDAPLRSLLTTRLEHFERTLASQLALLPKAWVHGDGNAWNVLTSEERTGLRVSGLIDFGDLAHTTRVCDVAIAIGYALLRHEDVAGARALLAGYESVLPLLPAERALLPHLAPLRLVVSVAMSAAARQRAPENRYLSADAGPAARWLAGQAGAPLDGLLD